MPPPNSSAKILLVLLAGSLILILSFGVRSSFGLFLTPISGELGWGREVFAFALALQTLLSGALQPFAGAIADRYGAGKVIATSAALYGLGLYVMAHSASPTGMTIGAGVILGIALTGTGFPIVLSVVGQRSSPQRRSLFLGIVSSGGSAGQLLVVPWGQSLITSYGWQAALIVFAACSIAVTPLAVLLSGRAAQPTSTSAGVGPSLGQAVRTAAATPGFWFLTAGFFVCGFHVAFIAAHLPAFIVDSGLAASLGATAIALIGLGNLVGASAWGALGGRFPKRYALSTLYFARAILFVGFLTVPVTQVSVVTFAVLMGLLWLGTVPLTSGLVAELFGVQYMATLFGFVFFSHQVGGFLGAWLGGYVFDATGSYDQVWWAAVALGLLSALLHIPIREANLTAPAEEAM